MFLATSRENDQVCVGEVLAVHKSRIGKSDSTFHNISLGIGVGLPPGNTADILGEVVIVTALPDTVIMVASFAVQVHFWLPRGIYAC